MIASPWKWLRNRVLSVPPEEVLLARRGFHAKDTASAARLEGIGASFLIGYHAALADPPVAKLIQLLDESPAEQRGFVFEGAAMAIWLLDHLLPWPAQRPRWPAFHELASNTQPYIVHVGIGWALARLPWTQQNPETALRSLDTTLGWLAIDGYGFHEGYFHTSKWLGKTSKRPNLSPYGNRVFDQGLGRSLWFVEGTDVDRVAHRLQSLAPDRHDDLWSGVGLACAYAGQPTLLELDALMEHSGDHYASLAQGVSFGTEARVRAGIATHFTQATCMAICGMEPHTAALMTQSTLSSAESSASPSDFPIYEQWRSRLRRCFSQPTGKALAR